jgi:hypothetical protein
MTSNIAGRARRTAGRTARRANRSPWLARCARAGLAARAVLYLVLAGIAADIALSGHGPQADPGGALRVISDQPLGEFALVLAAVGFAVLSVTRLVAGVAAYSTDHERWPAVRAVGEAIAYGAFAVITTAFLLGDKQAGTERSHHTITGDVLDAPAGRWLVAIGGVAVIVFYCAQLVIGLTGGFEQRLDEHRMPGWVCTLARVTGTAGYAARAVAFIPIGVFLLVTAVTHDPGDAKGFDATVHEFAGHWWGVVLLVLVALGFFAYAVYATIETVYRDVDDA